MSSRTSQDRKSLNFNIPQHERLLSIFFTGIHLRRRAREFFAAHGLSDVQFNILALIHDLAGEGGGISQVELSRRLLVNRSNITSLIDRMEKGKLVRRVPDPDDRRRKVVQLTSKGRKSLLDIEDHYAAEVRRIMSALTEEEQRTLERFLSKIRDRL